ncbi:hypothetical protein CCHOA_02355 [Corynebacterium choanae]|uniref:Uncharacterized protein n=1 Tax=Corynebacterium choanae TaxID=1862358 RepID=A0A3G6J7L3_9CORY|nr:hypothetical protein CCHOA_02355 [Corynebacterium choanae]
MGRNIRWQAAQQWQGPYQGKEQVAVVWHAVRYLVGGRWAVPDSMLHAMLRRTTMGCYDFPQSA